MTAALSRRNPYRNPPIRYLDAVTVMKQTSEYD